METRRDALKLAAVGLLTSPLAVTKSMAQGDAAPESAAGNGPPRPQLRWASGIEGQRKADLGDGTFLNPVLAGDYPDPTILKDGDDYFLTHSSFDAAPGLLIWHSRDLVNWQPLVTALAQPLGTVFAPEIVKHDGRYFIYLPFMRAPWSQGLRGGSNIFVTTAPAMEGPWSEPVDTGVTGYIDPGHIVGEDGHRYLFLSAGARVRLTPDGIAAAGPVETVYEGWRYPDEWVTEAYALEGPKLFRRGGHFYIVTAVGGTGGPPTGHMIVVSRSASIHGPWEHCPHNPIVRTASAGELWWSRGHATCAEGPGGQWYMVYHGYENGFRTLGRQTLLEPIVWDDDGWFHAMGGDLSHPLPLPGPDKVTHGLARSDDFSTLRFGALWTIYANDPREDARVTLGESAVVLTARGNGPQDATVLTQQVGDRAYEITVEVDCDAGATGGLLLFFNDRLFLGMGLSADGMVSFRGGKVSHWREPAPVAQHMWLRITNQDQIVTFYYSLDGESWTRHGVRSEVSGYHANTVDDLLSLRPALFAAGGGEVRFRQFRYRALG